MVALFVRLNIYYFENMFKAIQITETEFKDYSNDSIEHLSKVNLFVGQNNSGKSMLLRKLFVVDKLKFKPEDLDIDGINSLRDEFLNTEISNGRKLSALQPVTSFFQTNKKMNFITTDFSPADEIYSIPPLLHKLNLNPLTHHYTSSRTEINRIESIRNDAVNKYNRKLENYLSKKYSYNFDVFYFPTLRGLRPLNKASNTDIYKQVTITDYFNNDQERIKEKIYTGLTFYDDLTDLLLGLYNERIKVNRFQTFLSKVFFKGKSIDLIPNRKKKVVYIKIGDEPDYPIYRLGDGIQMIIILMYPLFFKSDTVLKVFIEEPELYLHPGMQRILLDSLSDPKLFPNHQFFITTHSNHFLDMTADIGNISIYTVQKNLENKKFDIENIENSNSDVLNLLGVKNSSVFLSNCTIWVEGITDRIYLRKFLEVYFKSINENNIKEDIHFSFVEYGGGNITHWSFLENADEDYPNINVERLCGKLFLISDKDGAGLKIDGKINSAKKKKYERHQKLSAKLGDRYYCLESREIENLLSPEILEKTIKLFEKHNFDSVTFTNWEIDKYKNKPLGTFLDKNVKSKKRVYSANPDSKSSTINAKLKFAQRATTSIEDVEDLSDEAKLICEKIYDFIKDQNATV